MLVGEWLMCLCPFLNLLPLLLLLGGLGVPAIALRRSSQCSVSSVL